MIEKKVEVAVPPLEEQKIDAPVVDYTGARDCCLAATWPSASHKVSLPPDSANRKIKVIRINYEFKRESLLGC